MKPLNSGHLRVLKNLSASKRCPLLGGSLTKTVKFGTKHFVRYLGYPLLGGFTVVLDIINTFFLFLSFGFTVLVEVLL